MIKRKYFIERKYLKATIFLAAAAIVTASVSLLPDNKQAEVTVVDWLECSFRLADGEAGHGLNGYIGHIFRLVHGNKFRHLSPCGY
jgi:hypothetical protein